MGPSLDESPPVTIIGLLRTRLRLFFCRRPPPGAELRRALRREARIQPRAERRAVSAPHGVRLSAAPLRVGGGGEPYAVRRGYSPSLSSGLRRMSSRRARTICLRPVFTVVSLA